MAKNAPKKGQSPLKTRSARTKGVRGSVKDSSKVGRDSRSGQFRTKKDTKKGDPPGL